MTTIVSYSEIYKLQTCKRQYYYRFDLGLKPVEESGPIATGVKGHKLLENFYRYLAEGKSKEEAHALTTKSADKLLNKQILFDSTILPAWLLVDNYIRETEFTAETILIENRFLYPASKLSDDPIFADVQIGFTPDVVLKRKGDFIDVEDYKFVQRAWSKSKINRYQQSKIYQILLTRMGYNVSRSIIRFFNVQTAKITEQPYILGPQEEETIIRDFMAGAKEVLKFKLDPNRIPDQSPRTMCYTACQFCAFEFPCTLEAEGKDASKTLQNLYVRNDYDYNR
jgi:CRISPR/Cas system-associated exonuclease Cas4 (RecB family)